MAEFILVHGSGQNPDCWSRVSSLLKAQGHSVVAPSLPRKAPGWGLEEYAATIAESVGGPHTVVIAHSFSGVFLPLVGQMRDCGLLVFLAAVIPEPGKSVRDQYAEDRSMFSAAWIEASPRCFDESQAEDVAREFLFHDCDDDTLVWALRTVEIFDTRHLSTRSAPFTKWTSVPAASIVATEDRTLSPDWGRRTCRRVLGREAIEIHAGHCPHVSKPREIAGILEHLATGAA